MRTIVIFRGLPGCGKSTLAAELCKKESGRWVRINRDDLRAMVVGPNNNPYEGAHRNSREEFIRNMKAELTRQAIREGYDVILDDTHLVASTLRKLHELALSIGDIKVIDQPTISQEYREGLEKASREKIVYVPPQAFGYSSYVVTRITIADLKAELATREHVPNKQEAKVLRRKKNQQNRRKGRGDR